METKIMKPQYISYVRYAPKKEDETETPTQSDKGKAGKVIYYGLIAYSAMLLLTPGWVIGLPIIGTAATVTGVQKILEYKNTPRENKLVINRY